MVDDVRPEEAGNAARGSGEGDAADGPDNLAGAQTPLARPERPPQVVHVDRSRFGSRAASGACASVRAGA